MEMLGDDGEVLDQAGEGPKSGLPYLLLIAGCLALVGALGLFLPRRSGLIWWIGGFLGLTLGLLYLQLEPASRGEGVESRRLGAMAWLVVAVAVASVAWNAFAFSQWVAG